MLVTDIFKVLYYNTTTAQGTLEIEYTCHMGWIAPYTLFTTPMGYSNILCFVLGVQIYGRNVPTSKIIYTFQIYNYLHQYSVSRFHTYGWDTVVDRLE